MSVLDRPIPHLRRSKLLMGLTALGLLGAGVGWWYDPHSFYFSYLVAWFFALTIVLGMMFFVLLQHVTDAGWSVVVRRPAEQFLSAIPLMAVLAIPLVIAAFHSELFKWTATPTPHEAVEKAAYLNLPFLMVRLVFYFAVFFTIARIMRGKSLAQDVSGDPQLSWSMRRLSAPGFVIYALSFTFLCFDWIMSLQYEWFSTIFGVYVWSGSAVAALGMLSIFVVKMSRRSLRGKVDETTIHDLGKLLFAFAVFWAYIAFSQFFLIWYANIPEETSFFLVRWVGPWKILSVLLLFIRFVLPFVILMSALTKRRPRILVGMSVVLLLGHYLDLYWLIMPNRSADGLGKTMWIDAACLLGVGGLMLLKVIRAINGSSPFPLKDPRLHESLSHGHGGHHGDSGEHGALEDAAHA
ncbi:hypothetical protein BH10PLA1_BH10PLA1_21200 [soil metagenome]